MTATAAIDHVVAREGQTLAAIVRALLNVPWARAKGLCETGRVTVDGAVVSDVALRPPVGAVVRVDPQARAVRRAELADDAIVFVDRHVVVVDKPSGVMTVPFEDEKDTLVDRVRIALRRRDARGGARRFDPEVGVVQRLDKETSGLLVFARSVAAKKHLAAQLRVHSMTREYIAIVNGAARSATHDTMLIEDRGDGLRGSYGRFRRPNGPAPEDARRAITHVRVVRNLNGATLVACRLETGRQHQIRIHLSEAGNPLVGESVYVRGHAGPRIEAPRLMLHARRISFVHPAHEEEVSFERDPPSDFREVLGNLGGA